MANVFPLIAFLCLYCFVQVSVASTIEIGFRSSRKVSRKSSMENSHTTEACETDADCNYRGNCVEGKCVCFSGVRGEHCEIIDECVKNPDKCGSDPDAICTYNKKKRRATCRCQTKSNRFDVQAKKCVDRKVCDTDAECNYRGDCLEGECECYGGVRGRNCEIIKECAKNPDMCGSDPDAICMYYKKKSGAICRCKTRGKRFDVPTKTCVDQKTCEWGQCLNGGRCDNYEEGPHHCKCLYGTSGDYCERVEGCISNPDYCGKDNGAECRYNNYLERIYCQCLDQNQRFDWPLMKCVDRKKCRVNDECLPFGTCHNKCSHFEACTDYEHIEKVRSCHCIEGTSGENCEIIDDCYNKIVDCGTSGNATCDYYYNHSLYAYAYCKCKDSKQAFNYREKVCKDK